MVDGDLTKGNPYFYSTYEVKYGPGEMFAAKPTQFELRGCKMDWTTRANCVECW
jgi:hypothetical protein